VSGKTKIEVSDRDWDSSRGLKLILMEYLNCLVLGKFPSRRNGRSNLPITPFHGNFRLRSLSEKLRRPSIGATL
jgi:hypothetical protein